MAKISELAILNAADGDEIVPVVKAGRARRMPLQVLADKAGAGARAWAEGPVPVGGTRSSRGWAQVAEVNAATSDQARLAVQQAIAGIPSDASLMLETPSRDVMRRYTNMPAGRLAYLSEPYRQGVWQWRLGDYSAQIALDIFEARYLKAASVPAAQGAWERVIVGGLFQFAWTGLNPDTVDALPLLQAGCKLFDANGRWLVPGHRMPMPTNTPPILLLDKPGVSFYGLGRASHFDYTGASISFFSMIQIAASGITVDGVHGELIAPNNSAANPAFIGVQPDQAMLDAGSYLPELTNIRIRNASFGRTSTGLLVGAYGKTDHSTGFRRPTNILIEDVEGTNNGAAISLFGGEDVEVRNYDFRRDPDLPSNTTAAKDTGFRILGTVEVRIGRGRVDGYQDGVYFDAAYFGARAKNKNISVDQIEMANIAYPFLVVECEGECWITNPVIRHSLDGADNGNNSSVVRVLANLPLSTIPADHPDSEKFSTVGDVLISGVDAAGYAIGVFHQGASGKLTILDSKVIGNRNASVQTGQRGAVLVSGIGGMPTHVCVNDNDFRMTVAPGLPSMQLQSSSGLIEARRNLLPERTDVENSISVPAGHVFHSDDIEQRPYNGLVNLGTNTVHQIGTLANWRDGTPLPAAALPAPVVWARNLIGVSEDNNVFTKTAGAGNVYDAGFYSTERLTGDFELLYRLRQRSDDLIVGLTSALRGVGYGATDFATYYTANGAGSIYLRAGFQVTQTKGYSPDTIERWRRIGGRLIFSRGNVDLLSVTISTDLPLGLLTSIARMGDAVEILRFGPV